MTSIRPPTRWDSAADQRLRELYAADAALAQIATQLGRTYKSVAARRDRLGLPPRRRRRAWSSGETALLIAAGRAGIPTPAVAERLGRSVDSVRNRRRLLALQTSAGGRPYLSAEDAAIRECFTEGGDAAALAKQLGRSLDALRLRARALGVYEPPRRRRWTEVEDAVVRDGYGRALSCAQIARQLVGRSPGAVTARARKLGLADFGRTWMLADDARLRALHARGHRIDEIAEALVRTPEAVRARCRRLGLSMPASAYGHAGRRWTRSDDELLTLYAALNPAVLARLLKRSDRAVTQRIRKLGLTRARLRSPHHPAPRCGGLTPAERRVAQREVAGDRVRALIVAARLGREPRAIRVAGGPGEDDRSGRRGADDAADQAA